MEINTELAEAGVPRWRERDIDAVKWLATTQFPVSAFLRPRHPFEDWSLACREITSQLPALKGLWAEYAGPTRQRRYGIDFYAALVGTGKSAVFLPPSKTEADFWDHKTKALFLPVSDSGKYASVDQVAKIMGLFEVSNPEDEKSIRDLLGKVRKGGSSIAACEALFQLGNLNAPESQRQLHIRRRRLFEIMMTSIELSDVSPDHLKRLYEVGEFITALRKKKSKGALPGHIAYVEALLKSFNSQEEQVNCWQRIARSLSKEATLKEIEMGIQDYAREKEIPLRTPKSSPINAPCLLTELRKVQSLIANRYPEDCDSFRKLQEVIRSIEEREKTPVSEKVIGSSIEDETARSELTTVSSETADTPLAEAVSPPDAQEKEAPSGTPHEDHFVESLQQGGSDLDQLGEEVNRHFWEENQFS